MKKNRNVSKFTYYLFAPHLEENEKIIFAARRHPFVMLKEGLKISFFGFVLPIILWYLFPEIWFVFLIWILVGVISMNKVIFNWYFDAILVTNISLIDVKWNGPFDRTSIRMEYQNIQGVMVQVQKLWNTIFNYGLLQVVSAGGIVTIELEDCINPNRVESIIIAYQDQYLTNKNHKEVETLKSLLGSMVSQHVKEIEVDF